MEKLKITPLPGHISLEEKTVIGQLFCKEVFENEILANAASRFSRTGEVEITFTDKWDNDEYAEYFTDEEGYVLTINENGACIAASTPAGSLYGAITLELMVRQYGENLPCGVIADKPYWRHRGAQISYAQANVIYRDEYLRHFICAMAELKINTVYLYLEWRYQFPSIPETHYPEYISPEQAAEIQKYAKSYNITVVPALNVIGHTGDFLAVQAFHDLGEYDSSKTDSRFSGSAALCTSNPRMRSLVENMLSDIMDVFDCEIIHVGGDEVAALGLCEHCKQTYGDKPAGEIYIDYMCWVRDLLKAGGRRMGIYSDMLLSFCRDDNKDILEYAKKLLDHTVIYDWAYDHWQYGDTHKAEIDMLSDMGADIILSTSVHGCSVAAPWLGQSVNQHDYFVDSVGKNIRGGLATDWIYAHGYHGAQMGPLFATAAALMWQCPDQTFATGSTAEETLLAYAHQTYGIDRVMVDYWNLAGGGQEDILRGLQENGRNGSVLRRCAYLDDSPLGFFIRYARLWQGEKFDEICAATELLGTMWDTIEKEARFTVDLPYAKGPLVLYRYLINKFKWAEELYEAYVRAANVQYTEPETFRKLLTDAAARLREYLPVFDEPLAFLQKQHVELGQEKGSVIRLKATKENLQLLADFMEHLTDSHRPLPAFSEMNNWLFVQCRTNFWVSRCDEWYDEAEPFTRTDLDNYVPWGGAWW